MEQKLGRKIKKLRELRNYSQDYMAAQLGISQPSYSNLETDDAGLNADRLKKIADLLQITISDIENFDERMIFHISQHNEKIESHAYANAYVQNLNDNKTMSDKVYSLMEDKVKLLEDQNALLKEQVHMLKEKIKELERRN
ncbi:MAG TPA: helix-turn-helix transcriptional regulator [Cytophagales bacterium]|nr:helix-turn-helix transcriptional regulator [Cytophagales bacterium]